MLLKRDEDIALKVTKSYRSLYSAGYKLALHHTNLYVNFRNFEELYLRWLKAYNCKTWRVC